MNDIPSPTPAPLASENAAEAIAALQKQVRHILVILVLAVVVLDGFMAYQWKVSRKVLKELEPPFLQMKAVFDRDTPTMNNFLKQLTDYARTHPDFQAVLAKYPFQAAPISAVPAAAAAQPVKTAPPAPAPAKPAAPAPKK